MMEHPQYIKDLHHDLSESLRDIASLFRGTPKLTLVIRNGNDNDHKHDLVISNDDAEQGISAIRSLNSDEALTVEDE